MPKYTFIRKVEYELTTTLEASSPAQAIFIGSNLPDSEMILTQRDVIDESLVGGKIDTRMFTGFKATANYMTPEQLEWLRDLDIQKYLPYHYQSFPDWATNLGRKIVGKGTFRFTHLSVYGNNTKLAEEAGYIYAFFSPFTSSVESEYGIATLRSRLDPGDVSIVIDPYVPVRLWTEKHIFMMKGKIDGQG